MKKKKPLNKPGVFNFRATEEQIRLFDRIMNDLGMNKTEVFDHLCEMYEHALKIIWNSK